MKMKITVSTDWQDVHRQIRAELKDIGYNSDFDKLIKNIDNMVSELSKIEVVARRTKNTVLYTEKLEAINYAIDRLFKLIIMAKLMK